MPVLHARVSEWLSRRPWPSGPEVRDICAVLVIWLAIALVFRPALGAGEFWWTDESRHAMDGVFFLDLGRDLPWRDPYRYALEYFATYPALALNWYPPFFAGIEALFFAVFGISEFTARLTVMGFALLGGLAWYAWVKPIWGRGPAILSFVLFFSMPSVVTWTRSVMLEVPAVAMMVLSILGFERYLQRPNYTSAVASGFLVASTLLLKQGTIFLLPTLLFYGILSGRGRLLWRPQAAAAYLIVGVAVAALAVHALKFGTVGLGATVGNLHESAHGAPPLWSASRWLLYVREVWQVGGLTFTSLAIVGAAHLALGKRQPEDWLAVCWLASWYLTVTLLFGVPDNAARYTMYALPPLALVACRPLYSLQFRGPASLAGGYFLLGGVVLWNLTVALAEKHPHVSGYRDAAEYVLAQADPGVTLFAGKHDGNFIFNVRRMDPNRETVTLRADKVLVSMAVHKYFGTTSHVKTADDILDLIDRYGVGTIVIEKPDIVRLPEFELLAGTLNGPQFELLAEMPLDTNLAEYAGLTLQIFRYLDKKQRSSGKLVIPLPHMGLDIELPPPQPRPSR